MTNGLRCLAVSASLACLLILPGAMPRAAQAGVSDTVLALAGPLAAQFGVPATAVTGLLEGGISLESVTQLLLVSQSSSADLEDVAARYRKYEGDVTRTADDLQVAASAYSEDEVDAAIARARKQAQADGAKKLTDDANKALESTLGGLKY